MKIKLPSIENVADVGTSAEVTFTTPVDEVSIYVTDPNGRRRKMLKLFYQHGLTAIVVGSVRIVPKIYRPKKKKAQPKSEAGHES